MKYYPRVRMFGRVYRSTTYFPWGSDHDTIFFPGNNGEWKETTLSKIFNLLFRRR